MSGLQATVLYEAFKDANQNHKWPGLLKECMVCRVQAKLHYGMGEESKGEDDEELNALKCVQCDNKETLWMCLICSSIGCGRYFAGHAVGHY